MQTARKSTQVLTGECRFSFVNIFQPRAIDGQDPKYSLCLLIPKNDTATMTRLQAAADAARQSSASLFGGKVPDRLRLPWHDGDAEMPNGGSYGDECKGHWVLNCSARQKPGIVDRNVNDIIDPTQVYSGCYGRVDLNLYAYNTQGNKGIGAGLNNVQKLRDGEALGGKQRAQDVFDAVEDAADDLL